jgi:hypothetical protein
MRTRNLMMAAAMAVGVLGAARADAQLTDDFESYADTAALQTTWTTTGAAAGLAVATSINFTPPAVADQSTGLTNLGRFSQQLRHARSYDQCCGG